MQVQLTLTPGYRLKIARVSRMSALADRALTSLAAVGGSAAFLEILRAGSSADKKSDRSSSNSTYAFWRRAMPCARRPTNDALYNPGPLHAPPSDSIAPCCA
jgi:hypothetical protein